MNNDKLIEFANSYQKKICLRGRSLEQVAAEASYSASVVETAHPNRKIKGVKFDKNLLKKCKDLGVESLIEFLNKKDYSHDACIKEMEIIRDIYISNNIYTYNFGNAQKWVSICMKYYMVLKSIDANNKVDFSKVEKDFSEYKIFPIDNIIMKDLKNHGIYLLDNGEIKKWYEVDNLSCFENVYKECEEKIGGKLYEYEFNTFSPSKKSKKLKKIYHK